MRRFGDQSGKASMGLVVFLLVAFIVVYEAIQFGPLMFAQFQFHDSVVEIIKFTINKSPEAVRNEVMARANELSLPLDRGQINVYRQPNQTRVQINFQLSAEWMPGRDYSWNVDIDETAILY